MSSPTRICLVDSRINEQKIFMSSVTAGVSPVLINWETETYEILLMRIKDLGLSEVESVAYVAHASFENKQQILASEEAVVLADAESGFSTWSGFVGFLQSLVEACGIKYFDFLGCGLAASTEWTVVFDHIEASLPGLKIRASTDNTGNMAAGGDWILEREEGVDAKGLYFTDAIGEYMGLLIGLPITQNFDTTMNPFTVATSANVGTTWVRYAQYTSGGSLNNTFNRVSVVTSSTSPSVTQSTNPFLKYDSANDNTSNSAYILSPIIDLSGRKQFSVSFRIYHTTTSNAGSLDVRWISSTSISGTTTTKATLDSSTLIRSVTANSASGNIWQLYSNDISNNSLPGSIYLIFKFTAGSALSNIYIDNILIDSAQSIAPTTSPTINSITTNLNGDLGITFTQTTDGIPSISRYYIQHAYDASFNTPINTGYVNISGIGTDLSCNLTGIYFTQTPVWIRVVAGNGILLATTPNISTISNKYTYGVAIQTNITAAIGPDTSPNITSAIYDLSRNLTVKFTQLTNGSPSISRYYLQHAYDASFNNPSNTGYNDISGIGTDLSFNIINILFSKTPVWLRVIAGNGTNLSSVVTTTALYNIYTIGDSTSLTITPYNIPLPISDEFNTEIDQATNILLGSKVLQYGAYNTAGAYSYLSLLYPVGAFSETGLRFNSYDTPSGYSAYLISPYINLTQYKTVTISFAMYLDSSFPTYNDRVELVYINSDYVRTISNKNIIDTNATSVVTIPRYLGSNTASLRTNAWNTFSYSFQTNTLSNSIYFIIKFISAYGNYIYIDNLSITGVTKIPQQVTNIAATKSSALVNLSWTPLSTDAEKGNDTTVTYQVQYKEATAPSYTTVATLPDGSSTYSLSRLPFNKNYSFNIIATNTIGGSSTTTITTYIPCLLGDTRIITPAGLRRIDELRNGDMVITQDRRAVPIMNVYSTETVTTEETAPYYFDKDSITTGYPRTGFHISPDHAIALNGNRWIIPRHAHLAGVTATQDEPGKKIRYYHIELPDYGTDHLVLEGGTVVESFGDSLIGRESRHRISYKLNKQTGIFSRIKFAKALGGAGAGASKN